MELRRLLRRTAVPDEDLDADHRGADRRARPARPAGGAEIVTSLALSDGGGIRGRFRRYAKFAAHWAGAAPMPSVVFIEPEYTDGPHSAPNDDHPPTGIARGQAFLADIYATLIGNPRPGATR